MLTVLYYTQTLRDIQCERYI